RVRATADEPGKAPCQVRKHERVRPRKELARDHAQAPGNFGNGVEEQLEGGGHERDRLVRRAPLQSRKSLDCLRAVWVAGEPIHGVRRDHCEPAGTDGDDSLVDVGPTHGRLPSTTRSRPLRSRVTRTSPKPSEPSSSATRSASPSAVSSTTAPSTWSTSHAPEAIAS